MTIEAKIICDSVGPTGNRLTTFQLRYPRFIHAEFMTHRVFSRNASSSRAIPVKKIIESVKTDPAMPIHWGKNQRGMQAGKELDPEIGKQLWLEAKDEAIYKASAMEAVGFHKQIINRILEPFSHISVVCTATEYANFFGLRHHYMAQPEIEQLAKQMWEEYKTSSPAILKEGEWHLPYVTDVNKNVLSIKEQIITSVARCARVSYNNHDGGISEIHKDKELYDRLLGAQPIHASPAEHQGQAMPDLTYPFGIPRSGNFTGWTQYRKTLEGECIKEFDGPIEEK